MAAKVRIFSFGGVIGIKRSGGMDLTFSSIQTIKYPLMGRALLECTVAASAISEESVCPLNTEGVWIQVEPGKSVHYEVIFKGHPQIDASVTSPILTGETQIVGGIGTRISVLEVTPS